MYTTNPKTREWGKHVLGLSRIKLIYARITLTRFTTLYFALAVFSCLSLVIIQSRIFFSNTEGQHAIDDLLHSTNVSTTTIGLSFLRDGDVLLCKNIPGQPDSNCSTLVHRYGHGRMHVRDSTPQLETRAVNLEQCAISLMWLGDVLTDARREDLVILAYQLWLLSMSMMTLLNESLPHLFAALAARALSLGWAGFRLSGNMNLYHAYEHVIAVGKCNGFDPMGDWWSQGGIEVAALVFNLLDFLLSAAVSYKLFKVYASQTFSRVGASAEVHRVYKLVLFFSVMLQLAGFFVLAQTALWIGKISLGPIRMLADHFRMYLAGLIVTAVFSIPWLVLGWLSVRRESKILFLLFAAISCVLFAMATLTLISPLYRFVLTSWSFYATISITADVLLIATSVLAIVCRTQFGKGLAHFLRVETMLDEGDFTPVTFAKGDVSPTYDGTKYELDPELAVLGYSYPKEKGDTLKPAMSGESRKISAFSMILSDQHAENSTIHLSSTPALFQGALTRLPDHAVVKPVARSTSLSSPTNSAASSVLSKSPSPSPPLVEDRNSRTPTREPTKLAAAVVRSGSVPPARRMPPPGRVGLPSRPRARSVSKPAGNFF
ncbi:hypothetical protein MIND_00951700 [Mycena indigotica]|uniref:Uncharacterized protein n=1 Tax=Mycena indigotica TaxID=2126181 RepID=A0A8H6SCT9_9AGAR|nr:uncharacterized protein MIND_00951700 [Mycena indigotica]KAF7297186.1 hypothetical protein MIND_00951700 [Mycena indigotica]